MTYLFLIILIRLLDIWCYNPPQSSIHDLCLGVETLDILTPGIRFPQDLMFRSPRVRRHPTKYTPDVDSISTEQLQGDPSHPFTIRLVNLLTMDECNRVYRALLAPAHLVRFEIDPVSWNSKGDSAPGAVDNSLNGMDLNFILLADPVRLRFLIEHNEQGQR